MKALIDGHDNPDAANAAISKILKGYVDEGDAELDCQQLCDVAIAVKSYVVLDWPLRQKTGKHIRTFQSHMHDNGWNNVIEMSYCASEDMRSGTKTPFVSRLRGLINTLKGGSRGTIRPETVHIWMSLNYWIVKHGHQWKVDSNYQYTGLLDVLTELSSTCGGGFS